MMSDNPVFILQFEIFPPIFRENAPKILTRPCSVAGWQAAADYAIWYAEKFSETDEYRKLSEQFGRTDIKLKLQAIALGGSILL